MNDGLELLIERHRRLGSKILHMSLHDELSTEIRKDIFLHKKELGRVAVKDAIVNSNARLVLIHCDEAQRNIDLIRLCRAHGVPFALTDYDDGLGKLCGANLKSRIKFCAILRNSHVKNRDPEQAKKKPDECESLNGSLISPSNDQLTEYDKILASEELINETVKQLRISMWVLYGKTSITTQKELVELIEQIYDCAINNQEKQAHYANLCKMISDLSLVDPNQEAQFRALLVARCQKEEFLRHSEKFVSNILFIGELFRFDILKGYDLIFICFRELLRLRREDIADEQLNQAFLLMFQKVSPKLEDHFKASSGSELYIAGKEWFEQLKNLDWESRKRYN